VKPLHHSLWDVHRGSGPVLATAVHDGHAMRDELRPYLFASDGELRREEDPLTGIWASAGDGMFRTHRSRFEVDLNRSREEAFATRPEQTWGMRVWREAPPGAMIERSLEQHDAFYALMREWVEQLIADHGVALVLDIHSYNHRRQGPYAADMAPADNPDIDLGLTTLDAGRFGRVAERLTERLAAGPAQGRTLDVRGNVRYPDGGHFPEWVFATYGQDVCTITLEYKKFYMDEWTGHAYLPVVEDLRRGLFEAVHAAREELASCR